MIGYYVMGRYTSVAWCATKAEADKIARQLNYHGGTIYRVVPDDRQINGRTSPASKVSE